MLPEAFADSTLMVLAFAIGTAAAFAVAALLVNFVLGLVLNLLVKLRESPLRSIEIRLIGALRVPVVMVIVLYGIRLSLTSLSHASTSSLDFVSSLGQLGRNAWIVAVAAIVCAIQYRA